MKKKHNKNFFKKNDDAVAGIIVAILVIGLIITVLAVIQTVFVPQWMEQKEAEHMSNVFDQFALLKFSCDVQAIAQEKNLALTTSITLGNKELPMFQAARSYGSLQLDRQERSFEIIEKQGEETQTPISLRIGLIRYISKNSYFLDKTYTYEYGALITSQSDGSVISIAPNIEITATKENDDLTELNIALNIINTQAAGDKKSLGGYGTYPVQVRYHDQQEKDFPSDGANVVEKFFMPTAYGTAWTSFFNSRLTNAGAQIDTDYTIEYDNGILTIGFLQPEIVTIQTKISTVEVQLGLGWIE